MNKTYIIATAALIFSLLALMFYLEVTPINWLDGWSYRTKLTINSSLIDEELINFTVLVFFNSSRINWEHVDDYHFDIRFTDLNNSLLYFEVEFDWITNNSTWFWVQLPFISNITNTSFYCYYGNPDINEFPLDFDVLTWNKNYVMVNHMVDNTQTECYDSTINYNDGTKKAINEPIETDGKISKAQNFDGINDYVNIPDNTTLDLTNKITISAWINLSSYTDSYVYSSLDGAAMNGFSLDFRNGKIYLLLRNAITYQDFEGTIIVPLATWTHIVASYDATNNIYAFYVNGNLDASGVVTIDITANSEPKKIGTATFGAAFLKGVIDEVRIYNQTQTAAWIKTDYYSQIDNLLTYGSEEFYG